VDPGRHGAIAILGEAGQLLELLPTPMLAGGKAFDLVAIAAIFRNRADPRLADRGLFVTVEKLDAMPIRFARKGGRKEDETANVSGVIANHNRGQAFGWAWMLAAFRIPYELVRPQRWQRAMIEGVPGADTKARSIAAAKAQWPGVSLRRSPAARVDAADLADALLIAEYGRRVHQGGEMFARAAASGGGAQSVMPWPPGCPPPAE
jgi:hypothetical protein